MASKRRHDESYEMEEEDEIEQEASSSNAAKTSRADSIVQKRIVDKTRASYRSNFLMIEKMCAQHVANCTDKHGKLILPMSKRVWEDFLGHVSEEREDGSVKTDSTLQGYISAIKNEHKERKLPHVSQEIDEYISEFMQGYKRIVQDKRDAGIMKNKEGKLPVTFLTYTELAKEALFAAKDRTVFSSFVHLFIIMCWNLYARSVSIAGLRFHHLSWSNDSLVIKMSKHKGDQTGENIPPKHVFANPYNPAICPILALALHVFAITFRPDNDSKERLFPANSYDVFSKWLGWAIPAVMKLGHQVSDYGTHSFRKGIATFTAGFIGGPGIISIFLRAGWSLGNVQDRYLLFADGGDQLCGRIAAGLDFNEGPKFSVLPPRFYPLTSPLTHAEWLEIAPNYSSYPASFQGCLPFLLASLVFHYDWLTKRDATGKYVNISERHPIFQSRVMRDGVLLRLKDQVLGLNVEGKCELTKMTATGIPPFIDLSRQVCKLTAEVAALQLKCEAQHKLVMEELPKKVSEHILENFNVEGVQNMTKAQFEDLARTIAYSLRDEFAQAHGSNQTAVVPTPLQDPTTGVDGNGYRWWSWDSCMRRHVPFDFEFPVGSVKNICDIFIHGIPVSQIRPFRLTQTRLFKRQHQANYCKGMLVFQTICQIAVDTQLVENDAAIYALPTSAWDTVFNFCYSQLIAELETVSGKSMLNPGTKSYTTVNDWILKYFYDSD